MDWKGGGQVNYIPGFGELWWWRWERTMTSGFRPTDIAQYPPLGIAYVVLRTANRLPRPSPSKTPETPPTPPGSSKK